MIKMNQLPRELELELNDKFKHPASNLARNHAYQEEPVIMHYPYSHRYLAEHLYFLFNNFCRR